MEGQQPHSGINLNNGYNSLKNNDRLLICSLNIHSHARKLEGVFLLNQINDI